jgi:type 1 glutamine amidotransferase
LISILIRVNLRTILFIPFLLILCVSNLNAQDTIRILHYTETTGYDHGTRAASAAMFQRICDSLNANTSYLWILNSSDSSEVFDNLVSLNTFQVIVWANTSGFAGLSSLQRQNYEQYVLNGGNYFGIHAASDTYRHSTGNGNGTGAWDFYAENLSGCSVQTNPNHTAANYAGIIYHNSIHPILNGIPNPWNKSEEYYYWENGFTDSTYTPLLKVGATGSNSYDSSRMVAQYKLHSWGSKSFYTSLGHNVNDYINDALFELLLKNALFWLGETTLSVQQNTPMQEPEIVILPNPAQSIIYIQNSSTERINITLYDSQGNQVIKCSSKNELDISELAQGVYFITIETNNKWLTKKIFKN